MLSDNLALRLFGVLFTAAALLAIGIVGHSWASSPKGSENPPVVPAILFISVFAIVGVLALFIERSTLFDLHARIITLRRGFTFAPKVETYGFDQVSSLRLVRSRGSGNQGASFNQPSTLFLVTASRFNTQVKSYTYLGRARAASEDLSRRTGIPLDDQTHWLSGE